MSNPATLASEEAAARQTASDGERDDPAMPVVSAEDLSVLRLQAENGNDRVGRLLALCEWLSRRVPTAILPDLACSSPAEVALDVAEPPAPPDPVRAALDGIAEIRAEREARKQRAARAVRELCAFPVPSWATDVDRDMRNEWIAQAREEERLATRALAKLQETK